MTREEFLNLSDVEQTALLNNFEQLGNDINDVTAERNSLQSDYDKQVTVIAELRSDLQKTKEVNYTLARQVRKEDVEPESLLHEMFK